MSRYAYPILAVCLAAFLTPAQSKPRATPKELAEQVVEKKRADVPSLRVSDELNWFGYRLLGPTPDDRSIDTDKGTRKQFLKGNGVWDDVIVESADGAIVGLRFTKRLASIADGDAFHGSLRETLKKRLGDGRWSEIGSRTYGWSLKSETEYLDAWRRYASWEIAVARDPDNPLGRVIDNKPPPPSRIVDHLASVSIERPTLQLVMLQIDTRERMAAAAKARASKTADFTRQLEEESTSVPAISD